MRSLHAVLSSAMFVECGSRQLCRTCAVQACRGSATEVRLLCNLLASIHPFKRIRRLPLTNQSDEVHSTHTCKHTCVHEHIHAFIQQPTHGFMCPRIRGTSWRGTQRDGTVDRMSRPCAGVKILAPDQRSIGSHRRCDSIRLVRIAE